MASGSPATSPNTGRKGSGGLQTLTVKSGKPVSLRKKFPFQLVASGTAGVDELAEHLAPEQVFFGMLQIEIGSGTFARAKNIFITWCPDDHPKPLKRAKAMKSLKKAQECVGQCNSEITLTQLDQCCIDFIFTYLEQKKVFNADNIDGDMTSIREDYNRKMGEARNRAQENELRITQLQAQARQRIERRRRRSIGSEADSVMTDFTDFTDFTDDLDFESLALESDGLTSADMPPLGQPMESPMAQPEPAPEEPPEQPLEEPQSPATDEKVPEEEKKEEEQPKKRKKKKKKKKDDWSDDRPWTGERVLKCIQAETSPINWALFQASDSEIIPIVWGHGDLNSFRDAMPQDRVAYGLYRITFGAGRWKRTHRIFVMWTPDSMTKDVSQKVRKQRQAGRMNDVSLQQSMKRLLGVTGGLVVTAEDEDKITIEEFILRVRNTLVVDGDDEFMNEESFLAALEEEAKFFAEKKRQQEEQRRAEELLQNPSKKKKRKKKGPGELSEGDEGDDERAEVDDGAIKGEDTPEPNGAPSTAAAQAEATEATDEKEQDAALERAPSVAVGQGDEEDAERKDNREESPRTIARKERKKAAAKRRREHEISAQVVCETVKLVHKKTEPLVWVLFQPFGKDKK